MILTLHVLHKHNRGLNLKLPQSKPLLLRLKPEQSTLSSQPSSHLLLYNAILNRSSKYKIQDTRYKILYFRNRTYS